MQTNTWENHYQNTKHNPPAKLLQQAIAFVTHRHKALDLGAGALSDTKFLIREGFDSITVLDQQASVKTALDELSSNTVVFVQSSFEDFLFPENEYDLINAQYSLPFNKPSSFNEMFSKLSKSLQAGGIFTGQFFGLNDEWNKNKREMTFHSLEQVQKLLQNFRIIELREEEKDSRLANGDPKHWHVFHVIAQRL